MSPTFQTTPPARAVAPGRILRRELEARGWQSLDLAEIMGRPAQAISQIMTGNKEITPETAVQLGAALEMDPAFWLNLEKNYRLALARRQAADQEIVRRRRLRELVPCWREAVKRGWIEDTGNLDRAEKSVCTLLGISGIDEQPRMAVCRRHGSADSPEKHRLHLVWARRVEMLAAEKRLPEFRRGSLRGALPRILEFAATGEGVARVPNLLEELGIAFVIVPRLDRTHLEGAAWTSGKHPIIALTLRHDRIDNFWFNLLHELGHVLHGHKGVCLDSEEDSCGGGMEEREANELAAKHLGQAEVVKLWKRTKPQVPRREVIALAGRLHLHPGIVVGQLHKVSGDYTYHRGLQVKVKEYLRAWIDGGE